MKNKSLEAKLRAIQDLKAERYIGTQQAWEYLNEVEALYVNPIKIADAINERLKKELGSDEIYYPATQERVVGLMAELYSLSDMIDDIEYEHRKKMKISPSDEVEMENNLAQKLGFNDWKDLENKNPIMNFYTTFSDKKTPLIESTSKFLTTIFYKAQEPNIDNNTFGKLALENAFKDYPLLFPDKAQTFSELISRIAEENNWDYLLSKENLKEIRLERMNRAIGSNLSLSDRIDKIIRDQIDHRFDIRREIVSDLLTFKEFKSYKEAVDSMQNQLRKWNSRLKIYLKKSAPKIIKESGQKMIRDYKYFLTCLGSEKNFVERYLKT